jgi:hypothetical protein
MYPSFRVPTLASSALLEEGRIIPCRRCLTVDDRCGRANAAAAAAAAAGLDGEGEAKLGNDNGSEDTKQDDTDDDGAQLDDDAMAQRIVNIVVAAAVRIIVTMRIATIGTAVRCPPLLSSLPPMPPLRLPLPTRSSSLSALSSSLSLSSSSSSLLPPLSLPLPLLLSRRGKQAGFDASIGPWKKSSSAKLEAFDWGASPALELTTGKTSG